MVCASRCVCGILDVGDVCLCSSEALMRFMYPPIHASAHAVHGHELPRRKVRYSYAGAFKQAVPRSRSDGLDRDEPPHVMRIAPVLGHRQHHPISHGRTPIVHQSGWVTANKHNQKDA